MNSKAELLRSIDQMSTRIVGAVLNEVEVCCDGRIKEEILDKLKSLIKETVYLNKRKLVGELKYIEVRPMQIIHYKKDQA